MKSSNPILRDNVFENTYALTEQPMTVSGTINKLLLLSLVMFIGAGAVFYQFSLHHYDFVNTLTWAGLITGFILALVISFVQKTAPYLSFLYAFAEGMCLSGISCFLNARFPGIVTQAVTITFLTVFVMAFLYKFGIIKATKRFISTIISATAAIAVFYLIAWILMLFHISIPYFESNSYLAIGINVVIAIVAALNLIIDFDFIEKGANNMLPSLYEWYGAFSYYRMALY